MYTHVPAFEGSCPCARDNVGLVFDNTSSAQEVRTTFQLLLSGKDTSLAYALAKEENSKAVGKKGCIRLRDLFALPTTAGIMASKFHHDFVIAVLLCDPAITLVLKRGGAPRFLQLSPELLRLVSTFKAQLKAGWRNDHSDEEREQLRLAGSKSMCGHEHQRGGAKC